MKDQLTPLEYRVRDFIITYQQANQQRPTYQTIAQSLKIPSLNTIHGCMKALEDSGELVLRYVPGRQF
jgi:hypothetical protein